MCVTVPNFIKIGQTDAETWIFNGFFIMAAVRYLGFVGRLLGPPTITTWWSLSLCRPNLFKIDAVVSIIWNLQYFVRLASKRLFTSESALISKNCKRSRDPKYIPYRRTLTLLLPVLFTFNLQTKFEMYRFIRSKDMAWAQKCRNWSRDHHPVNLRDSQASRSWYFTRPTRIQILKSLALAVPDIFQGV